MESTDNKQITYAEAVEQIEAILARLSNSQTDIDTLAEQVRRATELIKLCKERLAKVEADVNEALKSQQPEA